MPAESQSSPEADWSTIWWGRGMVCGATGHVGGPGLTGVSVAELSCERCTVEGAVRAPPSPVWADASSAVGVPSAATASAVATAVGMGRVVRMTLLVVVGDPGLPVEWRHRPARRSPAAHRRPLRAHSGELGRRLHMRHALVYGLSGGGGVFFRLLGPLEVADEDRPVQFGEGRQRVVLVLLLLHRNEPISSDRLIDALWGESPPPTAAKVLQNYVGRLRRSLGDREGHRLQTHGRGYALRVEDGELDVDRFERLLREGGDALAGGRPADAARLLREALALWRGPALADVAYEAFAQPEIARLEEQRTVALERRIDADLALGRHADLVAELEALVARYPLREHLRGQRMLALYRCGRQAEALAAFRDARRLLVEEVGVEPGAELRGLHEAILRQDATLELAPADLPPELDAAELPALLGRRRELEWLRARWARARHGSGALVAVTGEAGMGRTRLAAELSGEVHRAGCAVLYVAGAARPEAVAKAVR